MRVLRAYHRHTLGRLEQAREDGEQAVTPGNVPPTDVDEVRVLYVDDGDVTAVNALLHEGWRLLACGVAEQREVSPAGAASSFARCAFILGRSRSEQVLAEATAVVEAAEEGAPITGQTEVHAGAERGLDY